MGKLCTTPRTRSIILIALKLEKKIGFRLDQEVLRLTLATYGACLDRISRLINRATSEMRT